MKIGIITAMSSEYDLLAAQLNEKKNVEFAPFSYIEGRINDHEVVLMQSGIGKVNAAVGATELIRHFVPDCIISTGVAGGIDCSVRVMDVVASQRLAYHDVWCGDGNEYGQVQGLPLFFEGNQTLLQTALSLNSPIKIHAGLICTGDQFISERQQLDRIKERFEQGLAVDMESASIAQVCYLYGVPFLSFRIISDSPAQSDENATQYQNFWGEMADRSFRVTEMFLHAIPNII